MNLGILILIAISTTVLFVLCLLCAQIYMIRHRIMEGRSKAADRENQINKGLLNLHFDGLSAEAEAQLKAESEKPRWEQPKSGPKTAGLDEKSKDDYIRDLEEYLNILFQRHDPKCRICSSIEKQKTEKYLSFTELLG